MPYATIGRRAQRVSQIAFLHLLDRGYAYQTEAPTLWEVDFRTAVAQAELEDREMPGAYHRIRFRISSDSPAGVPWEQDVPPGPGEDARPGEAFVDIETTRP